MNLHRAEFSRLLLGFFAFAVSTMSLCAAETSAAPRSTPAQTKPESAFTPIVASVTAPPIPVRATDGRIHLAYELVLINTLAQPVTINAVRARAGDRTLQELAGDTLPAWFRALGSTAPAHVLGPGQSGFVWIDATVDEPARVPSRIQNVIDIEVAKPSLPLIPKSMSEIVAETPVQARDAVVIAPPLRGQRWLDGDGCCALTAHRGAVNPINGAFWGAERFAIDFVRLDDKGRMFTGDKSKFESYPYYGVEVHAVADGRVVAVVGDRPEQTPGASPTGLKLDEYGGNYVVQDIGNHNYAFYAHLQTGSNTARIRIGQELKSGDVVGLLGNSGNSDAPHLHFHVMSGTDPLASNGVPFRFHSFELNSRLASAAELDRLSSGASAVNGPNESSGKRTDEMPLGLDVVTFPER